MEACERASFCVYFANIMKAAPLRAVRVQKEYCDTDKLKCALYLVQLKLLRGYCPESEDHLQRIHNEMHSMFPNDISRARGILSILSR